MACEGMTVPGQTLSQRKAQIQTVIETLSRKLAAGQARVVVGKNGAVTFTGLADVERNGVTDACAYRRLMVSGSALAKAKIAQAEQMAGRTVSKAVVGQGVHSHDGGASWSSHKH